MRLTLGPVAGRELHSLSLPGILNGETVISQTDLWDVQQLSPMAGPLECGFIQYTVIEWHLPPSLVRVSKST